MISEQEAREAESRLDDFYNGIAKDILARYALQELARRDWQEEPSEDGLHWIEKIDAGSPPMSVRRFDRPLGDGRPAGWYWLNPMLQEWLPVNQWGRVCKITERPA